MIYSINSVLDIWISRSERTENICKWILWLLDAIFFSHLPFGIIYGYNYTLHELLLIKHLVRLLYLTVQSEYRTRHGKDTWKEDWGLKHLHGFLEWDFFLQYSFLLCFLNKVTRKLVLWNKIKELFQEKINMPRKVVSRAYWLYFEKKICSMTDGNLSILCGWMDVRSLGIKWKTKSKLILWFCDGWNPSFYLVVSVVEDRAWDWL